jgi:serine/threonine protein kinase
MEYIEGAPPRGPLAPPEAVRLALFIAGGLEAAHAKGITYRDLKPANILITPDGSQSSLRLSVKLLDFGLALTGNSEGAGSSDAVTVSPEASTMSGIVLGTLGYMSPEQAQGKPADARSDIFSFGLVLYELLSGRRAFAGDSVIGVMAAILRDEPAPLTFRGGEAQPKLVEIVTRCLRKAPADRFQTMSEVRAALELINTKISPRASPSPAEETPSIAVLPFANMSADKDNECIYLPS